MFRKTTFFLAAFLAISPIFSQSEGEIEETEIEKSEKIESAETEEETPKISAIKFSGLKKTKEKYLRRILKDFEGKEADEDTLKAMESALQQIQLFEKIDVAANGSEVEVSVKEKISFLPLPFGAVSNGSPMFGLFIMDTNAFGVQDSFVFGGLYSPTSMMGFAMFSKQAVDITHPGFSASLSSSKSTSIIADEEENELFEYDHIGFGGSLTITEKISKYFSIHAGCGYSYFNADDAEDEYKAWGDEFFGIDRVQTISPRLSLTLGRSDWNGVFLSQKSLGVGGELLFLDFFNGDGFEKAQTASAKLVLQHPVFQKLRLMTSASAFWTHDAPLISWQGGSAASVSILASNFASKRLAGGNAGFEAAVCTTKLGTFSAYALYECAWYENFLEDIVFSHGPEFGTKLYLAKIAIPALSFGISYNASQKFWNTNFAFGMQF